MRLCKIIGCVGKHKGHGWCDKHYQRWKSHGSRKIGKRFGISESVVSNIKHRKTWAHIP